MVELKGGEMDRLKDGCIWMNICRRMIGIMN
jgi:hypothetical protein